MNTTLEQINIVPSYEKIQAMPEHQAKAELYRMQSIAGSLAYELYLITKYGPPPTPKTEVIDDLFKRYAKASETTGNVYSPETK